MVLMLIERFPDQAVRLMQHIGMVRSNDVLYEGSWNRRRRLPSSGMITHSCTNLRVGPSPSPRGGTAMRRQSQFLCSFPIHSQSPSAKCLPN